MQFVLPISNFGCYMYRLGSLVCSRKNGIIFNNEMDDFGAPNKVCSLCLPPNYIQPGKRPQSSMSPTIMLDQNGKVKMVIGASGGSMIPPGIIQVSLHDCWYNVPCFQPIVFHRQFCMHCASTGHFLML